MCLPRWIVDEDMIKVDDDKISHKWLQYLMHKSHKYVGCVGQPKEHDLPLVETVLHLEHYLPLVAKAYSNLVIPTFKINLGKDLRA